MCPYILHCLHGRWRPHILALLIEPAVYIVVIHSGLDVRLDQERRRHRASGHIAHQLYVGDVWDELTRLGVARQVLEHREIVPVECHLSLVLATLGDDSRDLRRWERKPVRLVVRISPGNFDFFETVSLSLRQNRRPVALFAQETIAEDN